MNILQLYFIIDKYSTFDTIKNGNPIRTKISKRSKEEKPGERKFSRRNQTMALYGRVKKDHGGQAMTKGTSAKTHIRKDYWDPETNRKKGATGKDKEQKRQLNIK